MNFCCTKFQTHWALNKQSALNIRIVKFTSEWLTKGMNPAAGEKYRSSSLRYYITWGYQDDFSLDLVSLFIEFCPFCGTNLYTFYNSDQYANEVEGETFKIV
ncbi:MAG: hypothetical protein CSA04_04150 [Bacteroidetes bacterium]|nr:MAG: hypothetical protein CSA04_04150 [Bacteroidota bacterium]